MDAVSSPAYRDAISLPAPGAMDRSNVNLSHAFDSRRRAERAAARLRAHGLAPQGVRVLAAPRPPTDSSEVLKDILVNGAIGAIAGAGMTAVAGLFLLCDDPITWQRIPLWLAQAILCWGAALGGLVGGAAGAGERGDYRERGRLARLMRRVVYPPRFILVAEMAPTQATTVPREASDPGGNQQSHAKELGK